MTSIASQVNASEPSHIWILTLDRSLLVFKVFFVLLAPVILCAPQAVGFTFLLLLCALPMDLRFRRIYGRGSYQFILRSLGLLLLWAVLSLTWSHRGAAADLWGVILVCVAGSLALVAAANMTGAQKVEIRHFIAFFLVSCVIGLSVLFLAPQSAALRLLQNVSLPIGFVQISPPHTLSILIVMIWPLMGLMFSKYSGVSGRGAAVPAGILVSGLALFAFRQASVSNLLALALGGAAFLCTSLRPKVSLSVLACLIFSYLFLAPIIHMEIPGAPLEASITPAANSWAARLEVWSDAATATFDAPILGRGFDTAGYSGAQETGPSALKSPPPRNLVLRIWLELGLVGVILTSAVLFGVINAIWRRLHNSLETGIAAAVLVSFLTLSILGTGAWPLWWVGTAWLAAGMVVLNRQTCAQGSISVRLPPAEHKPGGVIPRIAYKTAHAARTA